MSTNINHITKLKSSWTLIKDTFRLFYKISVRVLQFFFADRNGELLSEEMKIILADPDKRAKLNAVLYSEGDRGTLQNLKDKSVEFDDGSHIVITN